MIQGGLSHFVWQDGRCWGDRPSETYLRSLDRHVAERPDAPAIEFEGRVLSFAELDHRSIRMANGLAALGLAAGDRLVALLDNSEDFALSMVATNRLGAIFVPVNTAYRGEFLRHQLADCEAAIAICEAAYLDALLPLAPSLPRLTTIIVRGGRDEAACEPTTIRLAAVQDGGDGSVTTEVTPDSIACLIYTSGTTGPSKGCMISHDYLCSIGRRRHRSVAPVAGEITWSCLPLYHIASLSTVLIASLLAGEQASIAARFSVSGFWDEIERSRASSIVILASMVPLIAHAPETPAMRRCQGQLRVVTGVPMSAEDRRLWQDRFGVGYVNSFAYGQTEANLATLLPWGKPIPPLDSIGPASEDFDVMVADDDDRPVPLGQAGELLLRPRQPGVIFSGYWRRPEETLKAMSGLWWHTGDIVRMDGDGFLYFVDRKKDYLRARGENISSFEVESAVMRHPDVAEVAFHAIGLEDEIKATVILQPGSVLTEQDLFHWARDNLPYFAVPRFIEFRAELPKTPTGRVQKSDLRAAGKTASTWDAHDAGLAIRRKQAKVAG
jgi:crotonobetaine/carnitine-CoA ligase